MELYRKFECLAYRYFKCAEFLEMSRKCMINLDADKVLTSEGFRNGGIYVPFNPFFLNEKHKAIFFQVFQNEIKEYREVAAIKESWNRIHSIKRWIGVYRFTRERGEEWKHQLKFVLVRYIETGIISDHFDFTKAIFEKTSKKDIRRFLRILSDVRKTSGVISLTSLFQR